MNSISKIFLFIVFGATPLSAATLIVNWSNGVGTELRDNLNTPLFAGTPSNYDGDIVQLGYYTMATVLNPFAGVWVTLRDGTIGEKDVLGQRSGIFGYGDVFSTSPSGLLAGTPLAIRFFDATTTGAATKFNAVSDSSGAWNWVDPTTPTTTLTLSLSSSTLVWQDTDKSSFRTTIPVPEPSSLLLFAVASSSILLRRRKE
jgi:hypothetical protein